MPFSFPFVCGAMITGGVQAAVADVNTSVPLIPLNAVKNVKKC